MYCQSCGKQIPDDSQFCRFCGTRQEEIASQPAFSSPPPEKLIVPESPAARRRSVPVKEAVEVVKAVAEIAEKKPATVAPAPAVPKPAAPVATPAPVTPVPMVPAAHAPVVTTSDGWDYVDFEHSFAGRKLPAVKITKTIGRSPDVGEASKIYWHDFQGEISADLQRWTALGWQPTTIIGPEGLVMRVFKGYKDKPLLYWIIMILAAAPSVGISLIVALIPSVFVEPLRFVAKLRAPHGTPTP